MLPTTAAACEAVVLRCLLVLGSVGAVVGLAVAACGPAEESATPAPTTSEPVPDAGLPDAEEPDSGEPDSGFEPVANPCQDHPGEVVCAKNAAVDCDATGHPASEQDCGSQVCVPGTGCVLCIAGQHSCEGNALLVCNTAAEPAHWDPMATCNPGAGERCSATKGACVPVKLVGSTTPTGTYYQYALFDTGSTPFQGGYDVDSYGNYLYVNRGGKLDVYTIELLDSDGDGKIEPNQHPDNPEAPGPIEQRVLTFVKRYENVSLGPDSAAELYGLPDRLLFLKAHDAPDVGAVFEFVFGSGVTTKVVAPVTDIKLSHLGYDGVEGRWYASSEEHRRVFSYHAPSQSWVLEFDYPDLAGSHMDGMEVITDPNTGIAYVYVSDMTSDFLGQYRRDRDGEWVQVNLFAYAGTSFYLEGMGYGVLNHFWATGVGNIYEIGGGDLAKYTEPLVPPR
ncbi:MAG: hypothetical protein HY744_11895 [Deltaproteobacteria bacterium]|nr:hypothetical protein [Deltaproteobacteria bacterium]